MGIQVGAGLHLPEIRPAVVEPVHQEVGVVAARAADVEAGADRALRRRGHARHQKRQVGDAAAVQRHLHNLRCHDDVAARSALRVEQRNIGLDLDGLAHRAHLQHQVETRGLVHLQFHAGLAQGCESRLFDDQLVAARG
jgi:hypothetical protein